MTTVIYAHRGASGKAPENTMAAFRIALSEEAEGIETDVQLTKDGVPVLIHDERLRRTTGTGGYVKDVTYQQIKALNANAGFPTEVNTPVPSLEEFLEWAKDKPLHLNLELKNNKITYRHLEDIVLKQLDAYNLLDRTVISSFNPLSLKKLKQINPDIETALLTGRRFANPLAAAKAAGADALHIKTTLLHLKLVKACHKEGIKLRVYTPNRKRRLVHCMLLGCDGLITDYPDKAVACRKILKL
ncbi:glycerophosphodiester phosphodiesterase family protein [Virgibacillus halophilus]|uniref:glycerophosphodiester phosphodiesterase family protein n=1 Tax=Tigheibacillus halophilus TaxID=361280 RepID=UPI0036F23544